MMDNLIVENMHVRHHLSFLYAALRHSQRSVSTCSRAKQIQHVPTNAARSVPARMLHVSRLAMRGPLVLREAQLILPCFAWLLIRLI